MSQRVHLEIKLWWEDAFMNPIHRAFFVDSRGRRFEICKSATDMTEEEFVEMVVGKLFSVWTR